jgi:hypothetical protein
VSRRSVDPMSHADARAFVTDPSRAPLHLDTPGVRVAHRLVPGGRPGTLRIFFVVRMVLVTPIGGSPRGSSDEFSAADRASFGRGVHRPTSRALTLWVEAHIPGSGWTTFDPTPEEGRTPPFRVAERPPPMPGRERSARGMRPSSLRHQRSGRHRRVGARDPVADRGARRIATGGRSPSRWSPPRPVVLRSGPRAPSPSSAGNPPS